MRNLAILTTGALALILFVGCGSSTSSFQADGVSLVGEDLVVVGFIRWSPDGRYGAYDHKGKLYILDATQPVEEEKNPVSLLEETFGELNEKAVALHPSWSPDGRWLAFTGKQIGFKEDGPAGVVAEDITNIWTMAFPGKDQSKLVKLTDFGKDVREPEWLSMTRISFKDPGYRLYLYDIPPNKLK